MLGPRLENFVSNMEGKVILAKVDIDEHTDLAMDYGASIVKNLTIENSRLEMPTPRNLDAGIHV